MGPWVGYQQHGSDLGYGLQGPVGTVRSRRVDGPEIPQARAYTASCRCPRPTSRNEVNPESERHLIGAQVIEQGQVPALTTRALGAHTLRGRDPEVFFFACFQRCFLFLFYV